VKGAGFVDVIVETIVITFRSDTIDEHMEHYPRAREEFGA